MGDDDRVMRRRTSFERDLRELFLKAVVGAIVGVAIYAFSGWEGSIWVPLLMGWAAVYLLAHMIRGDGRHAD